MESLRKKLKNPEEMAKVKFDAERFKRFANLQTEIMRWQKEAQEAMATKPSPAVQRRLDNANELLMFYDEYVYVLTVVSLSQSLTKRLSGNLLVDGKALDAETMSAITLDEIWPLIEEDLLLLTEIFTSEQS